MIGPVSLRRVKEAAGVGERGDCVVAMLLCFLAFPGVLSAERSPPRCTLPEKEVLRIGCTASCPRRYIRAYENHHQAIDMEYFSVHRTRFLGVRITGTSHGGKIEEEFDNRPAVGVQFHPERSDREVLEAVYGWFLTSACLKASGKISKRRRQ